MIKKIAAILAVIIGLVSFGSSTFAEEQTEVQPATEQEASTASSISWWWE